jgi:PleD family two-component response regulator
MIYQQRSIGLVAFPTLRNLSGRRYYHYKRYSQDIDESVTSRLSSLNNKKKVLFVDDEWDMTSLFKRALESSGFSVDIFNDSERALRTKRRG